MKRPLHHVVILRDSLKDNVTMVTKLLRASPLSTAVTTKRVLLVLITLWSEELSVVITGRYLKSNVFP